MDRTAQLDPPGLPSLGAITSFGEDANGELYICDFSGGEVWKIVGQCPFPTTYCTSTPNSTGFPSVISSAGNGSMTNNSLVLTSFNNPPTVFGLFYYGSTQTQVTAFNGWRCVANNIHRLPIVETNDFGDAEYPFDVFAPPAVITPGSTWQFQFFYRDPSVGLRANYSDGLSVIFCAN